MPIVRVETEGDIESIADVNLRAFGLPVEAELVDLLRRQCAPILSLVAEETPFHRGACDVFACCGRRWRSGQNGGMGLAPMAVVPERQRDGVGTLLVMYGIDTLRQRGCPYIVVLGHTKYYPIFGFKPTSEFGLACQWPGVPDEAFMVLILDQTAMAGTTGVVRYAEVFNTAL